MPCNSINFYLVRVVVQNGSCAASHWISYFHYQIYFYGLIYYQKGKIYPGIFRKQLAYILFHKTCLLPAFGPYPSPNMEPFLFSFLPVIQYTHTFGYMCIYIIG